MKPRLNWEWLSFGLFYLFFLLIIAALSQPVIQNNLTSDTLYSICLYKDLFVNGYRAQGWVLPPAPYFFPDMALMFPLFALLPDYGYGLLFFNWILWSGVLLCLLSIGRRLGASERWSQTSSLVGMSVFFVFLGSFQLEGLIGYALLPTFHTGCLLWGVVSWVFILRWMQSPPLKYEYFFFSFVTMLMVFSDSLYAVQFLFPTLFALGLCSILDKAFRRLFLILLLISAAAYAGGQGLMILGQSLKWFSIPISGVVMLIPLSEIGVALLRFLQDTGYFLWYNPFFALWLLILTPISLYQIYVRGVRMRQKNNDRQAIILFFLLTAVVLSLILSILAIVVSGRWISFAAFRYLQTGFLFPCFAVVWLIQSSEGKIPQKAQNSLVFLAIGLSLMTHGEKMIRIDSRQWKLPYPDYVRHVDYYAAKYQLKYGLSDYWNAKYITVFSRQGLRINQVTEDLRPQHWISNPNWFRSANGEALRYDFVITERLDEKWMKERWDEPQERIDCLGRTLFIYKHQPVKLED